MSKSDRMPTPKGGLTEDQRVTFASLEPALETSDADQLEELREIWTDLRQLGRRDMDWSAGSDRTDESTGESVVDLLVRALAAERAEREAMGPSSLPSSSESPARGDWRLAAMLVVGLALGLVAARVSTPARMPDQLSEDLQTTLAIALHEGSSASSRLTAVGAAGDLSSPTRTVTAALVHSATRDPNVGVRLAAIGALDRYLSNSAISSELAGVLARSVPTQASPLVQLSTLAFLDDLATAQLVDQEQAIHAIDGLLSRSELTTEVRSRAADLRSEIEASVGRGREPSGTAGDRL